MKIRRAVEYFFDKIRGVWIADETLIRVFDISSQSKQKLNLLHGCDFLLEYILQLC